MNRLIIVGNGFDLSLGLKTGYKDFLLWYIVGSVEQSFKDGSKTIKNIQVYHFIDDLIEVKIPHQRSRGSLINRIEKFDTYEDVSTYLIKENILSYRFELLNGVHQNFMVNNWIDIEVMYYDLMIKKLLNTNLITRNQQINTYNKKFNILRLKLIEYLETLSFDYNNRQFVGKMNLFLEMLNQPFKNGDDVQEIEDTMFLNFNYTPTLYHTLSLLKEKEKIKLNHIHGYVGDVDSVIFGFGDELDNNYKTIESERGQELFQNIKSGHYFKYPNYKLLKSFIDKIHYDVHIVGHSCGISDRTLLNEIFEHGFCQSIKMYHYKKSETETDFFEKSIEIMRHFKDKQGMRNKIVTFNKEDEIPQFRG